MTFDPQNAVVLLLVAGAAIYLIRGQVRSWRGKKAGGCGSCGSCPSNAAAMSNGHAPPPNVISVESLLSTKR